MARQQVLVEELVRQEETRFIDQMGDLEAQRSAERNAVEEIETGIPRMRETVTDAFPSIEANELNRLLQEARMTLRRKAGLEAPDQNEAESLARVVGNRFVHKYMMLWAILIVLSFIVSMIGINYLVENDKSVATESQVPVSIEAIHVTGTNQVNINVYSSTDADEVLLYRNTSVVKKWQKGGNFFPVVEYHDRGTYVYFAEAFRDGVKTTSQQVQVVFGQNNKEGQQR